MRHDVFRVTSATSASNISRRRQAMLSAMRARARRWVPRKHSTRSVTRAPLCPRWTSLKHCNVRWIIDGDNWHTTPSTQHLFRRLKSTNFPLDRFTSLSHHRQIQGGLHQLHL